MQEHPKQGCYTIIIRGYPSWMIVQSIRDDPPSPLLIIFRLLEMVQLFLDMESNQLDRAAEAFH